MNPTPVALPIDPSTTDWLLDHRHPLPDFAQRGVHALRPRAEQVVHGRVIADAEFQSGSDRYSAVAILGRPDAQGVHPLIDIAIRRPGDPWPTLCSGLGEAPDARPAG